MSRTTKHIDDFCGIRIAETSSSGKRNFGKLPLRMAEGKHHVWLFKRFTAEQGMCVVNHLLGSHPNAA